MEKICLVILLLLMPFESKSQFVWHYNLTINTDKSDKTSDSLINIKSEKTFTSVAFKVGNQYSFEGSYIIASNDTILLSNDPHEKNLSDSIFSNLVVFKQKVNQLYFFPGNIKDNIVVYIINSGEINIDHKIKSYKYSDKALCEEPDMIEQEIWRAGLPEPVYSRIIHSVHNIIIHHSATDNSLFDYINLVRNIYLYHTQTRGWSDIGYNYLIAPDGTIFKGRDPDIYDQDNIKGAHFCASNTGTMGICLLGTYIDYNPSDTSIYSLVHLLSWKALKDSLDPLSTHYHPLNSELNVIAGHQDGCATLCPGKNLYDMLPEIRSDVQKQMDYCYNPPNEKLIVSPIVFYSEIQIQSPYVINRINVFELSGRKVYEFEINSRYDVSIILPDLRSGFYLLQIISDKKEFIKKVICIKKD